MVLPSQAHSQITASVGSVEEIVGSSTTTASDCGFCRREGEPHTCTFCSPVIVSFGNSDGSKSMQL